MFFFQQRGRSVPNMLDFFVELLTCPKKSEEDPKTFPGAVARRQSEENPKKILRHSQALLPAGNPKKLLG